MSTFELQSVTFLRGTETFWWLDMRMAQKLRVWDFLDNPTKNLSGRILSIQKWEGQKEKIRIRLDTFSPAGIVKITEKEIHEWGISQLAFWSRS